MNAWGVVIIALGGGLIYWAVKHTGSLLDLSLTGAGGTGPLGILPAAPKTGGAAPSDPGATETSGGLKYKAVKGTNGAYTWQEVGTAS